MISIRVSAVLQLFDGFTLKPLSKSASVFVDQTNAHAEYRSGGYYVLVNLEPGRHEMSIQSPYFQTERLTIEVGALPVRCYLTLKPSKNYPFSKEVTRLTTVSDEPVYLAKKRDTNEFKLAQDSVGADESEFRLYIRKPPTDFFAGKKLLLLDGERTEAAELLSYDGQTAKTLAPLRFTHKRGTPVYPCEIYFPENGSCFTVLDEPSRVIAFGSVTGQLKEIDIDKVDNSIKL